MCYKLDVLVNETDVDVDPDDRLRANGYMRRSAAVSQALIRAH